MIKTQSQRRLSHGLKGFRHGIPGRHGLSRPQPQHQTLFRQRNRSRPIQSEGPIVGHHRDRSPQCLSGNFPFFRLNHSFRVKAGELIQRCLVNLPKNRNENPVLGFHRKSNVNGTWVHDPVPHQSSCGNTILPQGNSQGPHGIKRGPGFVRMLFPMKQQGIHFCRSPHRGQGTGPTPAHGIGHRHPHGGSRSQFLFFQVGDESFKVLDRDPPFCATRCQPGQISRM